MPKIMWKSLHLCFPTNLTKCYTSSSAAAAAATEDPSRPSFVLINNFTLLYHNTNDIPSSSSTTTTTPPTTFSSTSTSSYESEHYYDISPDSPPPDFSAAFASRRFFFSSPGRSNAITDSPETKSKEHTKEKDHNINTTKLLSGGTVVKQQVYSPDPLTDFRQSMQEMIDAAIISGDLNDGYDFLNELLLSYLSLNPVDTHKFIIGAFSDILVSLLSEQHPVC